MSTGQAVAVVILGEFTAAASIYMSYRSQNETTDSWYGDSFSLLLYCLYMTIPLFLGGLVYYFELSTLGTILIVIETILAMLFSFAAWVSSLRIHP